MSKKLTLELIFSKINNINNDPKNIRFLNIWGNQISDISILSSFPLLEKINLNNNQIEDISAFKNLTNIKELSLKDNNIKDLQQIEYLKNNKKLEKLNLINNPICKCMDYFQKIMEILPQLKEIDNISNISIKNQKLKINNNNFNSPLISNKDNININNISPELDLSKNNLSNKSSNSDSVSSDKKGEAKNDSAAPDPQASLLDDLDSNININQEININNEYINLKKKEKEKNKNDILNKSFKKKITEGSFRKVVKKNIFNDNNKDDDNKIKRVLNTDYKENVDKMSQTITSDFYKNPLKKYKNLILNEGGYKKKKIENFKKDHEYKGSNIMKHNHANSVFKEYNFFDNDNKEIEEEKKKNSHTPKKNKVFQKINKLRPLITTAKKNEINNEIKSSINEKNDKKSEEKIQDNKESEKKENTINKSIVESIKLLASTLSVDGLKQIQIDVQKLLEEKSKN